MKERTLLVLDSDHETLQKIMNTLQSEGYRVLTASSLDTGISLAGQEKPSLIFFSLRIAGTRGLEIFKSLHETQGLENIPIVILTTRDVTITSRDTELYGIIDYLKMNFSAPELLQKTNDILSRYLIPDEPVIEEQNEPVALSFSKEKQPVTPQVVEESSVQQDEEPVSILPADTESVAVSKEEQEETPDLWLEEEPVLDAGHTLSDEDVSKGVIAEERKPYAPEDKAQPGASLRKGQGRKNIFIISVLAILTVAGGLFFFSYFGRETGLQKQSGMKPPGPYQQPGEIQSVLPQAGREPGTGEEKKQAPMEEMQKPQAAGQMKSVPVPFPQSKKDKQSKLLYAVQIGGFKNETNALSLVDTYKQKGYDARLQKTSSQGGGLLFKVLIGAFEKRSDAQQMADTLRSREKIQGFVVKE